jgi:hypothetical protein
LGRPAENNLAPETLLSRFSMVRQFLPLLLETMTPHAADGGRALLAASVRAELKACAGSVPPG